MGGKLAKLGGPQMHRLLGPIGRDYKTKRCMRTAEHEVAILHGDTGNQLDGRDGIRDPDLWAPPRTNKWRGWSGTSLCREFRCTDYVRFVLYFATNGYWDQLRSSSSPVQGDDEPSH